MKRYLIEGTIASNDYESAILYQTDSAEEAETAKNVLTSVLQAGRIENKFDGKYDQIIDIYITDTKSEK